LAFGSTNNWPVCSLILRKISKIGATRCQIKCTKFAFRWGSALDPGAPRDLLTVLKGPDSSGREGKRLREVRKRQPTQKFWRCDPYAYTAVVKSSPHGTAFRSRTNARRCQPGGWSIRVDCERDGIPAGRAAWPPCHGTAAPATGSRPARPQLPGRRSVQLLLDVFLRASP